MERRTVFAIIVVAVVVGGRVAAVVGGDFWVDAMTTFIVAILVGMACIGIIRYRSSSRNGKNIPS
jgi:hypothetical protein